MLGGSIGALAVVLRAACVFLALMFPFVAGQDEIPSALIGRWVVGAPYDVGQPIGLNAAQEKKIEGLSISLAPTQVKVCGKTVLIESVNVNDLDQDQFLSRYRFAPWRIGLRGSHVTDVTINKLHSTNACGEFADPGTHLFISADDVVIETGNDYFALRKQGLRPK